MSYIAMNKFKGECMCGVSVIVPVYNVEKYIKRSLESICQQSFTDFEIILVNDETKDNSIKIAESLLEEYPFISYKIINQNNKGLPGARNTGIKEACGQYLCFIDSDDYISKNHLTSLYNLITNNNLSVAYSGYEIVHNSNYKGTEDKNIDSVIMTQQKLFQSFVKRCPAIHCCSLMISKELLVKNNLYFNEILKYGEDTDFMWKLFSYIDFVGATNNDSYKYLINEKGIMSTISEEKACVYSEVFKETIEKLSIKYKYNKKYYYQAYYRNLIGLLHVYASSNDYSVFKKLYLKMNVQKEMYQCLKKFPDIKIRLLSLFLYLNPKIFYFIFKERKV